ncbi:hypothetical protein [Ohtaekwangia koreensis]|uniref:Tellurite resistance protein TerB n=1 Tax=Ohtaekwangia koreensis TaxID=688867 RepID=A0A1T5KB11_9BACT|nr:hypothetical protein [Ohtaekwangia koreensis]SKC60689.1 hypothetical protein SAMN05660236_1980 [Ohtaekwangia koreensis]
MIPEFQTLTDSETELMLKAPILVCILIAGADGDIDRKEIKEAISIVQKQKRNGTLLSGFFLEMAEDFEDKIKILIQSYPFESSKRAAMIVNELTNLNPLWKKIDQEFSIAYYEMLKSISERIASSSGGLWGIKTVATEEAKYLSLPMITDPAKK